MVQLNWETNGVKQRTCFQVKLSEEAFLKTFSILFFYCLLFILNKSLKYKNDVRIFRFVPFTQIRSNIQKIQLWKLEFLQLSFYCSTTYIRSSKTFIFLFCVVFYRYFTYASSLVVNIASIAFGFFLFFIFFHLQLILKMCIEFFRYTRFGVT